MIDFTIGHLLLSNSMKVTQFPLYLEVAPNQLTLCASDELITLLNLCHKNFQLEYSPM